MILLIVLGLAAAAMLWPGSPAGRAVTAVTSGIAGTLRGPALTGGAP
jgi:hypothetical protein